MNRSVASSTPESARTAGGGIDLELVARRIIKLAEIAMLDHMESLLLSQATGVAEMDGQREGRRMRPGR